MRISATNWTTERVDALIKQVDKTGKVPKETPYFDNDTNLRKPNLNYSYTAAELLEMAKCRESVLYFGENMAKVMTDDGIMAVRLRDYQKRCLVQFNKYRKNILLSSRQSGKCVDGFSTVQLGGGQVKFIAEVYLEARPTPLNMVKLVLYRAYRWLSQ